MKHFLSITLILSLLLSHLYAYDKSKAANYQKLYANCKGKNIPKALYLITAEKMMNKIKNNEDILLLDVRTPAEDSIIGINYRKSMILPMNRVFNEESLIKLPTDKEIIVICRKGLRSSLIAISLRDVGFNKVFSLKGGMISLLNYLTVVKAN